MASAPVNTGTGTGATAHYVHAHAQALDNNAFDQDLSQIGYEIQQLRYTTTVLLLNTTPNQLLISAPLYNVLFQAFVTHFRTVHAFLYAKRRLPHFDAPHNDNPCSPQYGYLYATQRQKGVDINCETFNVALTTYDPSFNYAGVHKSLSDYVQMANKHVTHLTTLRRSTHDDQKVWPFEWLCDTLLIQFSRFLERVGCVDRNGAPFHPPLSPAEVPYAHPWPSFFRLETGETTTWESQMRPVRNDPAANGPLKDLLNAHPVNLGYYNQPPATRSCVVM